MTILLVGLGNPGAEYAATRHNLGFIAIDAIKDSCGFSSYKIKYKSEITNGKIGGSEVYLQKPLTYMNNSGNAVRELSIFYKIPLKKIIVFHDDLDLDLGRIKIKLGGGNAGHNGLKSIDQNVGNEFVRVRIGIGRGLGDTSSFVLGKINNTEKEIFQNVIDFLVRNIEMIIKGEFENFMTKFALENNKKEK